MPHNILSADLVEGRLVSFHAAAAITAGALNQGLLKLADYHMHRANGSDLLDQIGTSGDRWYGGCLLLAIEMAKVVDKAIDWDRYSESLGGVFTYEHVEISEGMTVGGGNESINLSVFLFNSMTPGAWYHISENWRVPSAEVLTKVLEAWAELAGIPLNGAEQREDLMQYHNI